MKLKCDTHGRRVLSVSTSPHFLHRNGDMSRCDSKTATLQDNISKTTRKFVVMRHLALPNLFAIGPHSTNKESKRA